MSRVHSVPISSPGETFAQQNHLSSRPLTAREQLGSVSILNEAEDYLNIDGFLYGCITMKVPPEATFPGIIRELLTCGFPLTISVHVVIPNQQKVIEKYKSRYKKMQAAQMDKDGNHKVDVGAAVQARELLEIQERLISGFLQNHSGVILHHVPDLQTGDYVRRIRTGGTPACKLPPATTAGDRQAQWRERAG